jgi:hypothetical protein
MTHCEMPCCEGKGPQDEGGALSGVRHGEGGAPVAGRDELQHVSEDAAPIRLGDQGAGIGVGEEDRIAELEMKGADNRGAQGRFAENVRLHDRRRTWAAHLRDHFRSGASVSYNSMPSEVAP